MKPFARRKLAREAADFAEGTTKVAVIVADAEPAARRIIGHHRAGRETFPADLMREVDAFEALHGPVGKYAIIGALARYADAYGAPDDDRGGI